MQVERLWLPRLRWRIRGAWQWPAFALLTPLDAVLLTELPFYARGPGSLVGGLLLATFANLLAVAVVAPLAGLRLRRARPDLPRLVAADYAGAAALCAVTLGFLAGGLLHRPAVAAEEAEVSAVVALTHQYVETRGAAEYRAGASGIDVMRIEDDLYRGCAAGPDPERALCVFVDTDHRPPHVTPDKEQTPNAAYRLPGGFR
jgi:hypothetical protein